ncbi:MAG TPA: phytoene/squalene synthase family protein [Candidatus Acidoferrum sp.]|nr:phytoene/squalene synthase family protein [Candidatus Acidoferrum sp.]
MAANANALLTDLLRQTSRSFYLTLRALPRKVRPQISLAYLLARTADTVADTDLVPLDQRLDALKRLRERISGAAITPLNFGALAQHQGTPAEKLLLEKVEDSLALLNAFSPADQPLVRAVLATITGGQELDLRRFAGASADNIVVLETAADLDDYTWRVAGCVGEFWTKMCRAHLFPRLRMDEAQLVADGVRFGKGLQLVNILRDLPSDLRQGRCYLPKDKLEPAGLLPEALLSPVTEAKFRPLFHEYLDRAEAHLAAGWRYTNTLPFGQMRVRLACAWPILIGMKTLDKLRTASVLDLQRRVKVSRVEVRGILLRSLLVYALPQAWQKLFSPGGKAVASRDKLA